MSKQTTIKKKHLGTIENRVFPELGGYKIKLGENYVVENEEELNNALSFVGTPCYMKGVSHKELHKTDKGLVREIKTQQESIAFFHELMKLKHNDDSFQIIVQRRYLGIELFLGIKKDDIFSYVMIFGFGGVFVEVYKDVAYGIMPITKDELINVIEQTKVGKCLLNGYRGYGIDIDYIYNLAKNAYKLLVEKKYNEIEFNPLIIGKNGTTTAVDIKIVK